MDNLYNRSSTGFISNHKSPDEIPDDRVLVQTPVYNCFFSSIRNNGCEIISNPLIYEDNTYRIDFDDLEKKAADPKVKLLLLCNPHNPAGRVWSKQELIRIGEICLRNDVWVVSDEIHCELVFPGHTYTPFASLSEKFRMHSVTCTSPSKAFNLAGLQIANIISADADIRRKIDKAININEVCDVNPFGVEALIAAYNEGEEWLEELKSYLFANYQYLRNYFNHHLPDFPVLKLEGTYLVWVDCSVLKKSSEEIVTALLEKEKVWVNEGSMYGKDGDNFIRIVFPTKPSQPSAMTLTDRPVFPNILYSMIFQILSMFLRSLKSPITI